MPGAKAIWGRTLARVTARRSEERGEAGSSKRPGRPPSAVSLGNSSVDARQQITSHLSMPALSQTPKRRRSEEAVKEETKVRRTNSLRGSGTKQAKKLGEMPGKEDRLKAVEGRVAGLEKELERWKEEIRVEFERKLEEKEERIAALEARIRQMEEFMGKEIEQVEGQDVVEVAEEINEQQGVWAKVLGRKMKEAVVKTLEDRKIQKKLVRVTVEAKDKKERERNIVAKGWKEVKEKGLSEDDVKDPLKVANFIVGTTMKM